jgi:hypothetical protein
MAEPVKPAIDVELLEQLAKKHFGPEFTAKLTWNVLRNRYLPSDTPGRLAFPQKVLGFTVWWKAVGEFRSNLGFRLEIWSPDYLPAARALCEEFNGASQGGKLDLRPAFMHWPASPQLTPTTGGR